MANFGPFLLFDGNCADAMKFYQSVFGGELGISLVGDTPMKAGFPVEKYGRVANAILKGDVVEITATDWLHPVRAPRQGNTIGLYISNATHPELKKYFDKLAVGADPKLLDELVDMPFGSYGHLADKYGVHWFFQGEN
jgi:PhnB protein